ncbi:MAG: hypothetical protein WD066_04625 [Planctomycetaceae bacterium]
MKAGTLFLAADREDMSAISDDEFLRNLRFDRDADPAWTTAASAGDLAEFTRRLRKRLPGKSRKSAGRGRKRDWPALWSLAAFPPGEHPLELLELIRACDRPKGKRAHIGGKRRGGRKDRTVAAEGDSAFANWLVADRRGCRRDPLELLCLFDLLAIHAPDLSAEEFRTVWKRAAVLTVDLFAKIDEDAGCAAPADRRLLIAGELRWKAGLLFDGLRGARALRDAGRETLGTALLEGTDTDGAPHADLLDRLAFWLAPLVRGAEWARRFDVPLWHDEQAERFHDLVGLVAPLCRADGRLALANGSAFDVLPLLTTASRLAGWKKSSRPHALLAAVEKAAKRGKPRAETNGRGKALAKRPPVVQSDWARLACLRSDWSAAADSLVIAHHRPAPLLDLSARGVPLLQGAWDLSISIDGSPLELADEWDCSCWHSDPDADFVELQMEFDGGVHIERQALLARDDHWLLLADCVSTPGDGKIDYAARVPVAADVAATADRETREMRLAGGNVAARVFPTGLPQDRAHGTSGTFAADDDGTLSLRQSSIGGLFAVLLIDWSPRRRNARVDWRTLTVTENGRLLSSADAAGHRIRLGDRQLVLYHSLRKGFYTRAVLGVHTSNETVIGRFDRNGDVQPILLVE